MGSYGTALVPLPEFGPLDQVSDDVHGLYVDGFAHRAVAAARRWQRLARDAGDGPTLRYLLYTEAVALQQLGRYADAVETARELLTVVQDHETVWRAKALAVVAEASTREGHHSRALGALAEADWLSTRIRPGSYGHLSASMAVALALRSLNLYEQADERLRARDFRVSPQMHIFAAQELAELSATWAVSLWLIGDEDGSRAQLVRTAERGLLVQQLARVLGNRSLLARGLVFEAFALQRLGHEDLADARLREAGEGLDRRSELAETQLARLVEARSATRLGRFAEARAALEDVIHDTRAARRDTWLATALEYLADVDVAQHGDSRSARIWQSVAKGALHRLWVEREARFDALRDREAIRRLTAEADRMGRAVLEDPLTGLGNRRMLQASLDAAATPPSAVFVDVDDFKSVNDTHSHAVGDEVLRRIGHVLRAQCRAEDVIVRYGGDEFIVLTVGEDQRAAQVAHRVHRAIRDVDWSDLADGLRVTVSVGVGHPGSGHTALGSADVALLAAKRAGRDRVVV